VGHLPFLKWIHQRQDRVRSLWHAEAFRSTLKTQTRDWHIHVQHIEGVKPQFDARRRTSEEAEQEMFKAHSLAGKIVGDFVRENSESGLESKLRYLTRDGRFSVQDFSGNVEARYLADGWFKVVYCVEFHTKSETVSKASVVLKVPKRRTDSSRRELEFLSQISERCDGVVPRRGDQSEIETGTAYFEEFIEGPYVPDLVRKHGLTPEICCEIISVLVRIYRVLGSIPTDIGHGNFVMREAESTSRSPVMIELGLGFLNRPDRILESINFLYGRHRRGPRPEPLEPALFKRLRRLRKASREKKEEREEDTSIFKVFAEILGQERGRIFLTEAFSNAKHDRAFHPMTRQSYLKRYLMHQGARRQMGIKLWGKGVLWNWERNFEFRNLIRDLEDFLKLSGDRREPLAGPVRDAGGRSDK